MTGDVPCSEIKVTRITGTEVFAGDYAPISPKSSKQFNIGGTVGEIPIFRSFEFVRSAFHSHHPLAASARRF
jgi:hypothetical protein